MSDENAASLGVGVKYGGATGLALVTVLYSVLAPTPDIRARIPFLVGPGGGLVELVILMILGGIGILALLARRKLTLRAIFGVLVTSLAYLSIIVSGIFSRLIPALESALQQVVALAIGLTLATTMFWLYPEGEKLRSESRHSQ